jgi:phosphoserine phosphatase RsbU/P
MIMANDILIDKDADHKRRASKYNDFQLGFITENIILVNYTIPLSDAILFFKNDKKLKGIAVEENDKVIGILNREYALQKGKSKIELIKNKPVTDYLEDDAERFDALDFCEKVFYKILKQEEKKINYLIIYEGTHFFGIIPFKKLLQHVTKLRELSYEQAHSIQQFYLDKNLRKMDKIVYAEFIKMAHQIGGDYYHTRKIADGKYLFACFDVSNKDIAASLTTGLLSSFFTIYFDLTKGDFNIIQMINHMNKILYEHTPGDTFVVAVFLYFEMDNKTVKIFNHAYSPIFICTPVGNTGKVTKINPNLMPLGIEQNIDLKGASKKSNLVPHTKFFVFSDGILDAINIRGIRFGDERIKKFVVENIGLKPQNFINNLVTEYEKYVEDSVQVDDITAIMIEAF